MVAVTPAPNVQSFAPAQPERVRIGVLDYGYWGPNLARNIASSTATELAAIADIDARRLMAARNAHPVARLTTEFDDVLADPSLDAIVIATPAATRSRKMLVSDDVEASEKLKVYDSGAQLVASGNTSEEVYRRMVEYRTGDVLAPRLDKTEALTAEIEHFARVVRGEEMPISCGARGVEIVSIIEAAQQSLRLGGAPVEVVR